LPGEIPDFLEVDLGVLENMDSAIHFGQLAAPAGIDVLNPPDEIIIKVVAPKVAATPKEAAAAAKA
jgi:hypothetical protein